MFREISLIWEISAKERLHAKVFVVRTRRYHTLGNPGLRERPDGGPHSYYSASGDYCPSGDDSASGDGGR